MQCVWCHARSGRQCGPQHAVRGEVAPVRSRERVIVFSCAAEPDIQSMRGKDLSAENGGVSTGFVIAASCCGNPNESLPKRSASVRLWPANRENALKRAPAQLAERDKHRISDKQ